MRASGKGWKFRVECLAASVSVISYRKGSCAGRNAGGGRQAGRAQPSGHQVRGTAKGPDFFKASEEVEVRAGGVTGRGHRQRRRRLKQTTRCTRLCNTFSYVGEKVARNPGAGEPGRSAMLHK